MNINFLPNFQNTYMYPNLQHLKKNPESASPKSGGQVSNQEEAGSKQNTYLLPIDYLLGLFFHPTDRGRMFLQNVGELLLDYMVSHPKA
jgi:hypothetical protein